ncbi:MAG TPA: protein kinase, partial [Bacteroidota bacterium]|nr:protein kinase [Bacteroidota bacterium]
MIGQTISHYHILEKLGEGGMGVVYKAQDMKLDRLVALKFLPPHLAADEKDKQRFIHEAKAASVLDHPNICTIYEIGETPDGQTFIAMACYEGETLHEKIANQPLTIDNAVSYAIQTAEGLQAAHKKGITHRDIKSSNIMVTTDGQVKIMDFGLAKTTTGTMLTKTRATVGTVPYMSPEQARGEKVDHRTDIWSLGVVMYEMLTGRLPFESPYSEAVVYSILNEEPKPFSLVRSDVPRDVENIVKKCLQKNPANRYQNADELIVDLRGAKTESGREVLPQKVLQPTRFPWRTWYLVGGALLVVAFLLFVSLPLSTDRGEVIRSIAVLPLDNLSRDPEQEYFADGMTEALITELSKISALKVISRTSAMQYKGVKKTIPQIARELDVEGIIEGSVLREGGRVRITVQLIHGATDKHLWVRNFDRELHSILALHSEVAQAIATEIHVTLTPGERAQTTRGRTVNPEAHDAYVRGRYHWNQRTPDGFQKAAEYFQRALDLDPTYALAYAGVADNYLQQVTWGILSPEDGYPRVKAAATRALEIDSSLAEPHVTLGYVLMDYDWDWEGAERAFRRALELNPNYPTGHHWYAFYLSSVGRHEAAISEIQRARELDPLSVIINSNVGRILYYARRYDEAESAVRKALEMNANFAEAHANLGLIYLATGRAREAAASLARAAELYPARPEYRSALAEAYVLTGQRQQARRLLEQLEKEFRDRYVPAGQIALVYGRLGERDRVSQWLDECLRQRDWWRVRMKIEPRFDFLRDNPRFQDLLRRVKFPIFESENVGSRLPSSRRMTEVPAEWHSSIAVLPFKNISPDKEQEYFCDGMTEAIITDLAKIGELIVMSPAAVSRYKGKSTDPIEIGRELKVRYIVEGSVQRMGTALRVSAQLTNTETGAQVWADRFDRTTREVFK